MARKQPKFRCHKCRKNLKSAAVSFAHFQKHPSHRTERQLRDFKANLALRERRGGGNSLPIVRRRSRGSRAVKYCTGCGGRRMPAHSFCGGCGYKLG